MSQDDEGNRPSGGERSKQAKSLDLKKLVDDYLMETVGIKKGGKRQRIPNYQGIMHQLFAKVTSEGNMRASNVLLKYAAYGASPGGQQVEVQFESKPEKSDEENI